MTDLLKMAEMVERAAADQQREILNSVFDMLFPVPRVEDELPWQGPGTLREPLYHAWKVRTIKFHAMMDAEAYESAALILVPDRDCPSGELFRLERWVSNGVHPPHVRATAWIPGEHRVYAATPALALAAAALRAQSAKGGL